jgi:hypothetical protein
MLASAVAAFVLVRRAAVGPSGADATDDVNGM